MLEAYADRWALITGPSSGIGEMFAHKLAARGMHLVLAARRRDRLEQLAADLHTRHGTHSEVVSTDLSDPPQARRLFDEVNHRGLTIELLVNNAGFGIVSEPEGIDVERAMQLVRLNVGAVTELTYLFLPAMLERRHGAIINLSSVAAFQPVAWMAAYAASKAYVLQFSEALWAEVRDRGVSVMALCPGVTDTSFFEVAGVPGWLKKQGSQSPDEVVQTALKYLEKRRQYVIPGWWNYLRSLIVRLGTRRRIVLESMKFFRPKRRGKSARSSATAGQRVDEGDQPGRSRTHAPTPHSDQARVDQNIKRP